MVEEERRSGETPDPAVNRVDDDDAPSGMVKDWVPEVGTMSSCPPWMHALELALEPSEATLVAVEL